MIEDNTETPTDDNTSIDKKDTSQPIKAHKDIKEDKSSIVPESEQDYSQKIISNLMIVRLIKSNPEKKQKTTSEDKIFVFCFIL